LHGLPLIVFGHMLEKRSSIHWLALGMAAVAVGVGSHQYVLFDLIGVAAGYGWAWHAWKPPEESTS
jgi:hypothetical protein